MLEPFIGQVMLAGFDFAPRNFATCDGQWLPIDQHQALFALLGTRYGGDGVTRFALPDLRGRSPLGMGERTPLGQSGGSERVKLDSTQMPAHHHDARASTQAGQTRNPQGSVLGDSGAEKLYGPISGRKVSMYAATITPAGNGQEHENMQPFNTVNFCIALAGIFPSRN